MTDHYRLTFSGRASVPSKAALVKTAMQLENASARKMSWDKNATNVRREISIWMRRIRKGASLASAMDMEFHVSHSQDLRKISFKALSKVD